MTAVCPLRRPRSFRLLRALRLLFAAGKEARPQIREVNAQAVRMLDAYGNSILRLAYSYLHNYSDAEEVLHPEVEPGDACCRRQQRFSLFFGLFQILLDKRPAFTYNSPVILVKEF